MSKKSNRFISLVQKNNLVVITVLMLLSVSAHASQVDIVGPPGSGEFGKKVTVLPNGNFVVSDPSYSIPNGAAKVGAVYLYGPTGTLISKLTGSTANDHVGSGDVTVLTNGNYVVSSAEWSGFAGAVTWGSATVGVGPSAVVSAANSLAGSTTLDQVGSVTALTNGNYVVNSPFWNDGLTDTAGAVTWGNGSTGVVGVVSAANSLVGSTLDDSVGRGGVTALTNGNYVVSSPQWNSENGAVTWCNGSTGRVGAVSVANSLVGDGVDKVGFVNEDTPGVVALTNGNYVVCSPSWGTTVNDTEGAVTWGNGSTGIVGMVSAANSLVGSNPADNVGSVGVFALTNGNYVVCSPRWDGMAVNGGAVTWANGSTGLVGVVSAANSLVGSTASDFVGNGRATALSNGNYVVRSSSWSGVAADTGAVTWCNGSTGIVGAVSAANSLVGSTDGDFVGNGGITALTNGNYVVFSATWDGAAADSGAVTWCNGSAATVGVVSASNSLAGSASNEFIDVTVTPLTNGNYVVAIPNLNGAVTWGNGSTGIVGAVSAANSLVGNKTDDQVGSGGVTALTNGNYVVSSPFFDGAAVDTGAVTWGNGSTGTVGSVSTANSLVGSKVGDFVAFDETAVANGNYVVSSSGWDGEASNSGAITFCLGEAPTVTTITAANSVLGTAANGGSGLVFGYDAARLHTVVGRPADNIVTIFEKLEFTSGPTATPSTAGVGQLVSFSSAAFGTGTLSFSWNIAGTVVSGPAPTFIFTAAGVYTAQLTVTTSTGGTLIGSVSVTVNAPVVGTGNDSDGDGFSDDFEVAVGTDPNNSADTPTGGAGTTPQDLTQSKLAIKLNFAKPASDSISFSGTLPIADGFSVATKTVIIDVGGVTNALTLDVKGKAPKGNNAFAISIKAKKGVVAAQTAKYSVKLTKGDFAAKLADEGLTSVDAKNATKSVLVRVIFGGAIYQQSQNLLYSAKAGKTGSAKAAK